MEQAEQDTETGNGLRCNSVPDIKEHMKKIPCYVADHKQHNRSDPDKTAPEKCIQIRAPVSMNNCPYYSVCAGYLQTVYK